MRSARFFEQFDGLENFFYVSRDLQASPFLLQYTVRADQKGAPFNAFDFFAIHDLVFDDAEHVAHFFFSVRNQLEGQLKFGFEIIMRLHVVS